MPYSPGSRDNQVMAIIPGGLVYQKELAAEIEKARAKLGPEAVQLTYRVTEDSTGDPAIFFRIVLTDRAAREETLHDITEGMITTLLADVKPIEDWGLHPYFNFSSQSEFKRAS